MELEHHLFYAKNMAEMSKHVEKELILEELKILKNFKQEKEARDFLKEKFNLKDDIENFNIASDIIISTGSGQKYFNITYEYSLKEESFIKSFNYKLEERSIAW